MSGIVTAIGTLVSISTSPVTIIGLVPVFAAGLAFMRYLHFDPESHPVNVRNVSCLNFFSSGSNMILCLQLQNNSRRIVSDYLGFLLIRFQLTKF